MYKAEYMELAVKEAQKAFREDEVPIGCVIVKDDRVIARAHNRKEKKNDAIAHAEIECIHKAEKKLGAWYLKDCELYVTLEPCIMCAGAIINSRIDSVWFAARDPKGGAFGSNLDITEIRKLNHYPEYGFHEDKEYIKLLKEFFKGKRKK
ncbi:MAG: nucleoside deaminase [Erysipelotrichaceae bacterium]|nr:nucleoside deaminase [Erysipelotrichaceae bacterium]